MDSIDRFERFIQGEQSNEIGQKIGSFLKDSRWTGRQKKIAIVLIALLAIGGPALAAALLFNQNLIPPTVNPQFVMIKNCDSPSPNPATVNEASNGFVTWACTSPAAAFRVLKAGSVTPTVSGKGAEWTSTYIWKESGTVPIGNCAAASVNKVITSGTSVTFSGAELGGWNYCSDFVTAPLIMSQITYTWTEP